MAGVWKRSSSENNFAPTAKSWKQWESKRETIKMWNGMQGLKFPGVAWRYEFRDHPVFVLWSVKWRVGVVFCILTGCTAISLTCFVRRGSCDCYRKRWGKWVNDGKLGIQTILKVGKGNLVKLWWSNIGCNRVRKESRGPCSKAFFRDTVKSAGFNLENTFLC